jgi:ribose 5-phosphate isomerase B
MKISIGADHRGVRLKNTIIDYLKKHGYSIIDQGTYARASVDYPHFAFRVARDVISRTARYGVLLCYTGHGMAITVNKVRGIRAAVCTSPKLARFARAHNNANVLVLPAGFLKNSTNLKRILRAFLDTRFEAGRHQRRLRIISQYEKLHMRNI